jgi:hypothetical protein
MAVRAEARISTVYDATLAEPGVPRLDAPRVEDAVPTRSTA